MKKTFMFLCMAVAVACLTGCMSDNKTWLLMRELKAPNGSQQAAAPAAQSEAKTTIEGPAEIKLEQGGKAVFQAGK